MPNECKSFYALPLDQGEQVFRKYDLTGQLAIYRCGMNRHPPDRYLAYLIAEKGNEIVPTLLDRLKKEKDEFFQYALVDIFRVLSLKGMLRDKPGIVDEIRMTVERMKLSSAREGAEELVREIDNNQRNGTD